ncbi:MAG: transcriptional regulator AraC family [Frankiales bacterium]|nr:transcriptional regulator AraC family [Frankiales bacterium]
MVPRRDALDGLLDGPRARGAFLLRSTLTPPWAMRVADEAPLTVLAVVRGSAHLALPQEAVALSAGDTAEVRGPEHYTVADDPATPPQVVIHPGQRCTTPDGAELRTMASWGIRTWGIRTWGIRTWGNSATGSTVLLTGTYEPHGAASQRLLAVLPVLVVQRGDAWDNPIAGWLADEVARDELGQEAALDRLLDQLLVATLRSWLRTPTRWGRAGTGLSAIRSSGTRSPCCTSTRPGPGRWPRWRGPPGCPGRPRPTVHRAGRGAADVLPRAVAARAGCPPARRTLRHPGVSRRRGGLRQRFRPQHRLHAGPRAVPAAASPAVLRNRPTWVSGPCSVGPRRPGAGRRVVRTPPSGAAAPGRSRGGAPRR